MQVSYTYAVLFLLVHCAQTRLIPHNKSASMKAYRYRIHFTIRAKQIKDEVPNHENDADIRKTDEKKVSFHAWIKLNTEQRRPMSNLSGIFSILIYENRFFAYSSMRIVMHTKKPGLDLHWLQIVRIFNLRHSVCQSLLRTFLWSEKRFRTTFSNDSCTLPQWYFPWNQVLDATWNSFGCAKYSAMVF